MSPNQNSINKIVQYLWGLILVMSSCEMSLPSEVDLAYHALEEAPDFNRDIRPILSDRCFPCHGPDQGKLEAGLRLDLERIAKGDLLEHPGSKAIVPGDPAGSVLVQRILSSDPELIMPPPDSKLLLNDNEKALLIKWIEHGAEYKKHWAFIPPVKDDIKSNEHPIDYFIEQKLESIGLTFNRESEKEILLRRLSFDLTGLPPSEQEMDAYLKDSAPDAYEKQVDRLLSSRHYGERMATDWLDVARYADTHGYTVDRYRDVSPYRDWVIESFNDNMPYDQFITWQIAGDLLPEKSRDQKIATTFLRLHPQNMEGGIVPEEFRVEYVADRTNTLGTAFMGLTLSCAKCHDHKFDPISQKEYYQLFSFFNNINEAGQISYNDAMPVPTMLLTDQKQDSLINYFHKKIQGLEVEKDNLRKEMSSQVNRWIDQEDYQKETFDRLSRAEIGKFPLDGHLKNSAKNRGVGRMNRTNSSDEKPRFVEGYRHDGLLLDGDAWLDLGGVGAFDRYEPFTVTLFIKIPRDLKDGVIFHRGIGAVLYNFRGFHLALKDNRLEMLMAHTAPDNAILRYCDAVVPREEWIHLALSYDGSGRAAGLNASLNGEELIATTVNDNLYKGLHFNFGKQAEPGIQIGARWRGKGIGGAIVDEIKVFNRCLTPLEILYLSDEEAVGEITGKKSGELTEREMTFLRDYYLSVTPPSLELENQLLTVRKQLCVFTDTIQELMVYSEMSQARPAFILDRGQYDSHKEQVWPRTPKAILAIDTLSGTLDRLDLARWLVSPQHPLTARVMVNRLWQQFFGRGLVRTAEDFGNQGSAPSHPQLLDHLSVTLIESGWDIKSLIKLIVTSRAYRQSSIASPEVREIDPENVWLSRGPSKRLSAEMIRDHALAASGLLNTVIGGPSVYPYQPEGLWKVNGASYPQSRGDDLYRRSLYTVWKRSVPHPTQSTFDAPERSECTMRRQQTNTPLQALALMNDPIFIDACRELGKMMAETGNLQMTYRKLTGRNASDKELDVLDKLFEDNLRALSDDPYKCRGWINDKSHFNTGDIKMVAYAVVASTILNSDASIFKR